MSDPRPHPDTNPQGLPECLDAEIVQGLIDLGADDPTLLPDLVDTFLVDAPSRIRAMHDAADAADPTALERCAHSLKSAAGNLGARMLAELCRELEMKGRTGDMSDVETLLVRVESEFTTAGAALRRIRG